jgi:HD-GYP domain-containing protein (c-di-GMP phosphodiesterase class II)
MTWRKRPHEFIRTLAQAVDAKGDYFPGHSDGVAYFIGIMCQEGGFGDDETQQAMMAGLLHDVGKVMIPERILGAARRLTPEEFGVIKTHSGWGAEIVRRVDSAAFAAEWVLHHHEHFDGSGYPEGRKGEEIPMVSRMLLVADAFHVMTTTRPYQAPRTRSDAIAELKALAGKQFCPTAVSLLVDRHEHVVDDWLPAGPPGWRTAGDPPPTS